ncbi:MAG: hypothetical protein AB7N76_21210 [Planctomycetota bacterium]
MKILRLAQARVLLWAHDRATDKPYEVSKVVDGPLQERCPSAPRCPEEPEDAFGSNLWIDPHERPHGACAYAFRRRGQCLRHRNQVALEAALFRPQEVALTRRLLESLGFTVTEESIDVTGLPARILQAHGNVSAASHQVRLLRSPSAGSIVLVREVGSQQRRSASSRCLRVLAGGDR